MTALATEPDHTEVTTLEAVETSDTDQAHLLGVDALRPVGLEELVEHAALMHRTDRKYIAPLDTVCTLVTDLADTHRVLEIKDRRYTTYRTLYFDTDGFEAARSHVQKRRRRWKVRSRLYVEDGLCRIEVKTKDNRGETQKVMGMSDPARYGLLADEEADFVAFHLSGHPEVRVPELVPAAEVCYTRATLSDIGAGTRVTIDWKLVCHLETGDVWMDDSYALIETKGPSTPGVADRALTHLGVHPRSFSKYVAAASTMTTGIADNDVRSLHGRVLHNRAVGF
ncbi:MAG: VTC domain-containing protein [Aeromicrobium sp.]